MSLTRRTFLASLAAAIFAQSAPGKAMTKLAAPAGMRVMVWDKALTQIEIGAYATSYIPTGGRKPIADWRLYGTEFYDCVSGQWSTGVITDVRIGKPWAGPREYRDGGLVIRPPMLVTIPTKGWTA